MFPAGARGAGREGGEHSGSRLGIPWQGVRAAHQHLAVPGQRCSHHEDKGNTGVRGPLLPGGPQGVWWQWESLRKGCEIPATKGSFLGFLPLHHQLMILVSELTENSNK